MNQSTPQAATGQAAPNAGNPDKPLKQVLYLAGALLTLTVFSVPLFIVALVTGFRARRFYAEVMVRNMSRFILWGARIRTIVHNAASVPEGPVFYMPNHPSSLDVFVFMSLGLPNTRYFLSRGVSKFLPLALIAWIMGVFFTPDQKKTPQRIALFKRAAEHLRLTGESILGSPEGRRTPEGGVGKFNRGVFHLATVLGHPIVPIYISFPKGTSPGKGFAPRPTDVDVFFLPPISTQKWRVEDVNQNKERVRARFVSFEQQLVSRGRDGVIDDLTRAESSDPGAYHEAPAV